MFGKPKNIEGLPAEDQAWAHAIGRFGAWKDALQQAVQENKPARVRYLIRKHGAGREMRYALALEAVNQGAAAALDEILAYRGFDFSDSSNGDVRRAKVLMQRALDDQNLDVWKALYRTNIAVNYMVDSEHMVTMAGSRHWRPALAFHLDDANASQTGVFNTALATMVSGTADDLAFVLSWTAKFAGHGGALNAALKISASAGDVDKINLLLDKGADPNDEAALALYHALEYGHRKAFDLLVARGGALDTHGQDLVTRLRQQSPHSPLAEHLHQAVAAKRRDSEAAAAQSRLGQRYHLIAPDSFSETLHLPEGGRLTTVFNFSTRQQTTIAERGMAAPVMAVTVRDFDDIADRAVLTQAEDRLISLGGSVPVVEKYIQKPGASGGQNPGAHDGQKPAGLGKNTSR